MPVPTTTTTDQRTVTVMEKLLASAAALGGGAALARGAVGLFDHYNRVPLHKARRARRSILTLPYVANPAPAQQAATKRADGPEPPSGPFPGAGRFAPRDRSFDPATWTVAGPGGSRVPVNSPRPGSAASLPPAVQPAAPSSNLGAILGRPSPAVQPAAPSSNLGAILTGLTTGLQSLGRTGRTSVLGPPEPWTAYQMTPQDRAVWGDQAYTNQARRLSYMADQHRQRMAENATAAPAPSSAYDRAMLNRGRSLPTAGDYRALHPTGGIDSAPGQSGLYQNSAAWGQQEQRQQFPTINQQGSIFQRWAHDPQRMAEFRATQRPLSPAGLAAASAPLGSMPFKGRRGTEWMLGPAPAADLTSQRGFGNRAQQARFQARRAAMAPAQTASGPLQRLPQPIHGGADLLSSRAAGNPLQRLPRPTYGGADLSSARTASTPLQRLAATPNTIKAPVAPRPDKEATTGLAGAIRPIPPIPPPVTSAPVRPAARPAALMLAAAPAAMPAAAPGSAPAATGGIGIRGGIVAGGGEKSADSIFHAPAEWLAGAAGLLRGPTGKTTTAWQSWMNPEGPVSGWAMPWAWGMAPPLLAAGAYAGWKPVDAAFKGLRATEDEEDLDEVRKRYERLLREEARTKGASAASLDDLAETFLAKQGGDWGDLLNMYPGLLAALASTGGMLGLAGGFRYARGGSSDKVIAEALKQRRQAHLAAQAHPVYLKPTPIAEPETGHDEADTDDDDDGSAATLPFPAAQAG